jgi:hypothetical protein
MLDNNGYIPLESLIGTYEETFYFVVSILTSSASIFIFSRMSSLNGRFGNLSLSSPKKAIRFVSSMSVLLF